MPTSRDFGQSSTTGRDEFHNMRLRRLADQSQNERLHRLSLDWFTASVESGYSYQFDWLGRPIIQYPQDVMALQDVIWRVKPDLIIECGIALGGSLIFSASMLALIDYCGAREAGFLDGQDDSGSMVVGIDIDIRDHNRSDIDRHPLRHKLHLIEGSSVAPEVVDEVHEIAKRHKSVLVCLDSNHSHAHVLAELMAYADLVSVGSYCVVMDTVMEDLPAELHSNRPWGPGDSPGSAVREFLVGHPEFEVDRAIDHRLLLSVGTKGYLKRTC